LFSPFILFNAGRVSLITNSYYQNREDTKLDKELEAALEIAETYAQSKCSYSKPILVEDQYPASQDRLISRNYQLFRPIEITHSWDNGPAAPPAGEEESWGRWVAGMRHTATETRGPFYDMTEMQNMWDSILPSIYRNGLAPAQSNGLKIGLIGLYTRSMPWMAICSTVIALKSCA